MQAQTGGTDGAVMRALASHQCCTSSIPGLSIIRGLRLLLVLALALRGFSPGTPVFPSPKKKPTFPNSNSIRNLRATGLSVVTNCLSVTLVKHFYFIYLQSIGTLRNATENKNFPSSVSTLVLLLLLSLILPSVVKPRSTNTSQELIFTVFSFILIGIRSQKSHTGVYPTWVVESLLIVHFILVFLERASDFCQLARKHQPQQPKYYWKL